VKTRISFLAAVLALVLALDRDRIVKKWKIVRISM